MPLSENFKRLHANVQHMNAGEAIHPHGHATIDHVRTSTSMESGKNLYHRFYGKKVP